MKVRLSLAVLVTALVAGCGGGGSAPAAGGRKLFTGNCAACHTLAAAAAKGRVGPNLDQLRPGAALVKTQVVSGGGGMPAFGGKLTGEQIQQIADYVAGNAGKS